MTVLLEQIRRTLMARLGTIGKRKNPQATELNQLKEELRSFSEKLEWREGELAQVLEQQTGTSDILRVIASSREEKHA